MITKLRTALGQILKSTGIKQQWLFRSMAVTSAIVIVGVLAYALAISQYYYSGMQSSLVMKARTATDFFASSTARTYSDYYQSAYRYTERFDERDKLELQFISSSGRIEASTYGITAGSKPDSPDIAEAFETKQLAVWRGSNHKTGERIIAVTSPLVLPDGRVVGLMRYVSSLSAADHLVRLNVAVASALALLILLAVVIANRFFIRSIVAPIREVTSMTRAIADGGYGGRIDNKYGDEIGEMVSAINDMSMKISQSEKLKTEFISSVSHELRTPLTAITGWGETLLYDDELKTDAKRGLSIILKEAQRLTTMVEELLDITRIEEGRFTVSLEPTDIEALVEESIALYTEVFRRDNLKLEYEPQSIPLPEIPGDPTRLKQVFLNVLDNAAKYGRAGGKIVVECGSFAMLKDGHEYVRITVRDYGDGIPVDELPYVKYKFYKGSSRERGNGIGLAVCEEIVKLHRGQLIVENAPERGVIVTVLLPMV